MRRVRFEIVKEANPGDVTEMTTRADGNVGATVHFAHPYDPDATVEYWEDFSRREAAAIIRRWRSEGRTVHRKVF
jgi:hypothetical protein